jgi:hypothetical protein
MRPIGFSTGALAKGDFACGVQLQRGVEEINAVELSALRDHELRPLLEAISTLELSHFQYVSFHAPSKLGVLDEETVVNLLLSLPSHWPIIVHPEIITKYDSWTALGSRLCLENMDNRKTGGRTVAELRILFELLPEATFCLDVGHAKQIDPTMSLAILMLREFSERLKQVHVSDVGATGEHMPVGLMARVAFSRLATHIPASCPLIIESIIASTALMARELAAVTTAFEKWVSIETLYGSEVTHEFQVG